MSKSIIQPKEDRACYLCRLLHGIDVEQFTHEHHIMFGNKFKKKAEHYGLKVNLCVWHHEIGKEAVHINKEINDLLREIAQIAFEKKYSYELWMKKFGKNYVSDEDRERYLQKGETC